MTGESRAFRVGQEVEVTYRARVVEVTTRSLDSRTVLRTESHCAVGVYISPDDTGITVRVIAEVLPTEPGVYWTDNSQMSKKEYGEHHTDGKEFHYLNSDGMWCDIGYGQPSTNQVLTPLVELPF